MSRLHATVLAWGLCACTLALAALAAVLKALYAGTDWGRLLPEHASPSGENTLLSVLDVTWLVAFAVVGASWPRVSPATRSAGSSARFPPRWR